MALRAFILVLFLGNAVLLVQVLQLARAKNSINAVPASFASGPQEGDLTLVAFFDFTCDACRAAAPVLNEALKRDGHIRYVARPLPGITAEIREYARLAYAAGLQDKFSEMNTVLMGDFRALDKKRISALAARLALDEARLAADMESPAVTKMIEENEQLYRRFYGETLPYYVINGRWVFNPQGTPSLDDFLEVFENARYNGA